MSTINEYNKGLYEEIALDFAFGWCNGNEIKVWLYYNILQGTSVVVVMLIWS